MFIKFESKVEATQTKKTLFVRPAALTAALFTSALHVNRKILNITKSWVRVSLRYVMSTIGNWNSLNFAEIGRYERVYKKPPSFFLRKEVRL